MNILDPHNSLAPLQAALKAYTPFQMSEEKERFAEYIACTNTAKKRKLEEALVLQYCPLVFKYAKERNYGKIPYADCVLYLLAELVVLIRKYSLESGTYFTVFARRRLYFAALDYYKLDYQREEKEVFPGDNMDVFEGFKEEGEEIE